METLFCERLPALDGSLEATELVLLHGWGGSSAVWRDMLPWLRRRCNVSLIDLPGFGRSEQQPELSIDDLLAQIITVAPQRAVYLGYSLGGMLATALAARFPQQVAALLTLASNLRFVADRDWPTAMDPAVFAQFYQLAVEKPAQIGRRFSALQAAGDPQERAIMRLLRERAEQELYSCYPPQALAWLREIDNRTALQSIDCPWLALFAERDALVPAAAAAALAQVFAPVQVELMEDSGHALPLSHPQRCAERVQAFLRQHDLLAEALPRERDKRDVARAFSRAAASYDGVAQLQRDVGERLLALCRPTDGCVLDLGSGTGFFAAPLVQRSGAEHYLGLDLAEGMAAYAAKRQQAATADWICGDAENLPLADQSVALIFSSLAIQWCEDLDALFAETWRVLRAGGAFLFATLGPASLKELRGAWGAVDSYAHVNQFAALDTVVSAAQRAGYRLAHSDQCEMTLHFASLKELTASLKDLGAHNSNRDRQDGLTGRRRLQRFVQAYESMRDSNGRLPLSYQVYWGVLHKP